MTTDQTPTPESARALLDRHGLPEDVIDGALALHAQELAAVQRQAHDASGYHMGQACKPEYECGVRATIDLIAPTSAAVPVPPPADQTASGSGRAAEAELYVLLRKAGEPRDEAQALIDRHRAEVLAVLPEQADRAAEAERPLSPDYEHPACGFHWHGRDGMDIPMRDGQPVCPRCELAKAEKKLAYVQRMRDEVGAECKRRGRIKLEQAERIVRLERELDGVRDQLGKEMLRADDAEAELRRVAAEEQPAETQDSLPAWLYQRFMPDGVGWESLDADDRSYWDHQARAVRRAVARGGFKADAERPAVGEQPETQETPNLSCSYWTHTRTEHTPHRWEPQPGMNPVHCPGYDKAPE